jgi:hypothetical protein
VDNRKPGKYNTHGPFQSVSYLLSKFASMKKMMEMFKGDKGEISSKRVVGIVGALVLFATMAHNSLSPEEIAPSKDLVAAVEFVVIACLGFTSIDKFANKDNAEG